MTRKKPNFNDLKQSEEKACTGVARRGLTICKCGHPDWAHLPDGKCQAKRREFLGWEETRYDNPKAPLRICGKSRYIGDCECGTKGKTKQVKDDSGIVPLSSYV